MTSKKISFNLQKNKVHQYPLVLGDVLRQYTNIFIDDKPDIKIILMKINDGAVKKFEYDNNLNPIVQSKDTPVLSMDMHMSLIASNELKETLKMSNKRVANTENSYISSLKVLRSFPQANNQLLHEMFFKTFLENHVTLDQLYSENEIYIKNMLNRSGCQALLQIIAKTSNNRRFKVFNVLYCLEEIPFGGKANVKENNRVMYNGKSYVKRLCNECKKHYITYRICFIKT